MNPLLVNQNLTWKYPIALIPIFQLLIHFYILIS